MKISKGIDWDKAKVRFRSDQLSNPATDVKLDSAGGTNTYNIVGERRVRLWRKQGSEERRKASVVYGGDVILPGEAISLKMLSPTNRVLRLYLEALRGSVEAGDIDIKVELNPLGTDQDGDYIAQDRIRATVFDVERVHPQGDDFDVGHQGRVLISAKHGGGFYTPYQTTNAQVKVKAKVKPMPPVGYPNLRVCFEVTDPDDLSHYEGKTVPGTPDVQGDRNPNDNRDPIKRMRTGVGADYAGYQAACLQRRWAEVVATNQEAMAETVLKITDRYAGDNYQVRATMQKPYNDQEPFDTRTSWTTNQVYTASTIAESAVMIAWKRVYIELDQMYKKGATLTQAVAAGSSNLVVDSTADFREGEEVVVFWRNGTHTARVTAILSATELSIAPALAEGVDRFGGIRPAQEPDNYQVDLRYLPQAFGQAPDGSDGGAFIEFKPAPTGSGKVPKYEVFPDRIEQNHYIDYWFVNQQHGGDNILYLLAAAKRVQGMMGVTEYMRSQCVIYVESNTGRQPDGSYVAPETQRDETVVHEIGHRFGLVQKICTEYQYIDTRGNDKKSHDGNQICIMSYDNYDDGLTEFSSDCLLLGSIPSIGDSLRDTEDR